jgi:nitrate reductase NapE component
VEDIEDRSKGDLLSKAMVLLQGLWFTAQCLARVQQHLPVTELEVATLAFQITSIFIWLLWLHKPLDVQQSILLGPDDEFVATPEGRLVAALYGFASAIVGNSSASDLGTSASVPSFWSTRKFAERDPRFLWVIIESLVGTIFGVIHCAVWKADFPSASEMWMWRSCSVAVAVIPLSLTLLATPSMLANGKPGIEKKSSIPQTLLMVRKFIIVGIFPLLVVLYVGARLLLIVLYFTTLRNLAPGAFVDVNWSMYIPHL